MGLLFSAILSYAGALEAIECFKHILAGMLPDSEPDFEQLVEYYRSLLHRSANPAAGGGGDWTRASGQGYLCLVEREDGSLKSAAVKYYDGSHPDSAAILFSTKISSFGQESVDSNSSHANGYGKKTPERYTQTTTTTIISNSSESFNIGQRNRSCTPTYENVSDPTRFSENSFEHSQDDQRSETSEGKEKLTWHYRPKSPVPQTLPEIHFQSEETENKGEPAYSEDFLRSLDGIKYRPLQRSDPSNRRRSYKKRHSSSSTSSKDSRASRDEELKIFTSLEEAEFERMSQGDNHTGFGSTPNLAAHSYSRSRSRENSKERRNESWSVEQASVDSAEERETTGELKPRLKELPKLGSFEEERPEEAEQAVAKKEEVTDEEEEEVEDFWGSSD